MHSLKAICNHPLCLTNLQVDIQADRLINLRVRMAVIMLINGMSSCTFGAREGSALHRLTDPIRYVSLILSIDIRMYHNIFRTIHQIGLKPTEICDVEWSFPGVNFMI